MALPRTDLEAQTPVSESSALMQHQHHHDHRHFFFSGNRQDFQRQTETNLYAAVLLILMGMAGMGQSVVGGITNNSSLKLTGNIIFGLAMFMALVNRLLTSSCTRANADEDHDMENFQIYQPR